MKQVATAVQIMSMLAFAAGAAAAAADTDDGFPEEIADNPYQVAAGERRFLDAAEDSGWLHAHNRLTISAQSLADGWVELQQCYANLDAVAAVDVVYRYRRIRGLQVVSTTGIADAAAAQNSVSLTSVESNARLCVRAEVQILQPREAGGYVMRNGPFHRRFLDGYFPMRVTLDIDFADTALRFSHAEPAPQKGFAVQHSPGRIHVDTRFTGKLDLAFYFD